MKNYISYLELHILKFSSRALEKLHKERPLQSFVILLQTPP